MTELDKYLETLTLGARFIGVLGVGYPNSFYRVFVQKAPNGAWWRFECGAGKSRYKEPPLEGPAEVVMGPLALLKEFDVDFSKQALKALHARVLKLVGEV